MRIWVTKDALTKGIRVFEATPVADGQMQTGERHPIQGYLITYHPGQWHASKEAAVEKAEKMRAAKIKSLEKQLSRVRGVTFG